MNKIYLLFLSLSLLFSANLIAQCDTSTVQGNFPVNITFNPNTATLCPSQSITFHAFPATGNQYIYSWNFGHPASGAANTSPLKHPVHTYPYSTTPQSYLVTLVVIDTVGGDTCNFDTQVMNFQAQQQIVLDTSDFNLCVTGLSPSQADTTVTFFILAPASGNFVWDFGDGSPTVTGTALSQTHTYATFGSYTITVNLVGSACPGFSKVFKWNTNPFTSLQFITNPVMCEGDTVWLKNTTLPPDVADYYVWNWGDGSTQTVNDTARQWHVYSFPIGTYCTTNPGNGGTVPYTITLEGTNNCFSQPISTPVNIKPKAHAEFLFPSVICVGVTATFDNESCPTWGGNVFSWNFGDPASGAANTQVTTSAFVNPTHVYTTPGVYTVTLIAAKTNGCPDPDTVVHQITVTASPVIAINVTSTNVGCAPFLVTFDNNTTPSVGVNYQWSVSPSFSGWYYANGTNSNSAEPQIMFTQAGNYSVSLNAYNACNSANYSTSILVKDDPILILNTIPNLCVPYGDSAAVNPSIYSLNWQNGTTQSYDWTFGNGTPSSSTAANPGTILFPPGFGSINLTVTNECGSDSDADGFTVTEIPQQTTSYSMSNPNGCMSAGMLTVNLFSSSQPPAASHTWSISPGSGWSYTVGNASSDSPTVVFTTVGNYTITHTVSNSCGTDTWQQVISVKDKPSISLNPQADICLTAFQTQIVLNPSASFFANNGSISNIDWTFSGGTPPTATGANPGNITFGPGSHTTTVFATNVCGTVSASDVFVVREFPNASATFIGNGVPGQNNVCIPVGGSFVVDFTNTSTPVGVTYNWAVSPSTGVTFTNGSATSANPQFTFTQANTYTVTLTATNVCGSDPQTFTFVVAQAPQVTINAVPDGCGFSVVSPTAVVVSNSGPITSYSWSFVGGTPTSSNIANPSPVTFMPGFDTLYLTVTNQCGTAMDSEALYIAPPPVLNVHVDTMICNNTGTINLWATPPGGTWTGTNVVQTTTTATATNATFTPSASGTFNAIYTFGTGNCLRKDTTKIIVNAPPVVDAGINFDVCEGDPPYVLAPLGTPAGGYWTDPNGNIIAAYNPTVDGNFWLTYHFTSPTTGCTNTDSVIIVVHPLPNILIPATATYCETTSSIILPPGFPTNGYWTGPPGTVSFSNLYNSSVSGLGLDTLRYHYTTQFGCTDSADMLVTVIPPIPADAGNDSSVCFNGAGVQLTGFPAGGTWLGAGMTASGLFTPSQTAPGLQDVIYTYGFGDCQTWDTAQVNVFALPTNIPGTYYGCISDSIIVLNNSTPLGGTWVGNTMVDSTFFPSQAGLGVTNLLYIVTDNNNCTDTSATTVLVTPLPIPLFLAPTFGCVNTLIQFQNLSANAGHYLWIFQDGTTDTTTSPIHVFADTGTYNVTLISYGQTPANCPDSIKIPITILDLPVVDFTPIPDSACATILGPNVVGIQVNFTDNSLTYNGTYSWQLGNGLTSTSVDPGTITYLEGLNDTMYVVSLAITNMCGSGTHIDSVKVSALPKAIFGTNVNIGCSPAPFFVSNISQGNPTSYSWIFGNGNTSTLQTPGVQYFTAPTQVTNYTITLIATNACGADTAYHQITVNPNNVTAFFNTNPTTGCAPLQVVVTSFTNGTNVSYDFGDGTGSAAANTVHVYTQPGTYILSQFADDGCSYDTTSVTIVVSPTPQASFSVPTPICVGNPIQFTLNTPGVNIVSYDFGVPVIVSDTSNQPNPVYTYPQAGTYAVSLTTYSTANGCPSTILQNVTIADLPTIDFATSSVIGCTPFTLDISNNTSQGTFHFWDFGNTQTSASANPSITYFTAGTYTITYSNTDANGCSRDSSFTITALPQPSSQFAPTSPYICGTPATFDFTNSSTGTSLGYDWDFGNGQTSTNATPNATYTLADTFTVSLIATNNFGCKDTSYQSVIVHPQPQATANISPLLGCAPLVVNATNNSTNSTYYSWNWGDGSPLETTFNPLPHTYLVSNTYNVSLVANYENVCFDTFQTAVNVIPSPIADFNPIVSGNLCGGPVTVTMDNLSQFATNYIWLLGNGNTSNAFEPSVTFTAIDTFTITLIVSTGVGCNDTISRDIIIHPAPTANAQVIPTQGCTPLTVSATNLSTGANAYVWTWGDGTAAETTFNPNPHTYFNDTTYTLTLISNYQNVCFDTFTTQITVLPEPVAAFAMNVVGNNCGGPLQVSTTNNSQSATSYIWNMGNGSQYSTLDVTAENYAAVGTFTITLVAFNNAGCKDSATQSITIHPKPIAAAQINPTQGCAPLVVSANNLSTVANQFIWTWGDGTPAENTLNPLPHTYFNDTTYTVTLIANYQNICFDTFTTQVTVLPEPVAAFTLNVAGDICGGPLQVTTNNTSQAATSYLWNMANGNQYSTFNVTNEIYTGTDTFAVILVATNNVGCKDSATQSFILHPQPNAQATISPTFACPPVVVNASNLSTNYTSLIWTFGDGSAAEFTTNPQPHTYFVPNTAYTMSLFLDYNGVCFDTLTQVIQTGLAPTAAFSVIDTLGDVCGGPATLVFNNTSSNATSYLWNMGDGQQYSSDVNPTAVYTIPNGYFIQLIASNTYCKDTANITYILHPEVTADLVADTTTGCSPLTIQFSNLSQNGQAYLWSFGDGDFSNMTNPLHQYQNPGVYTVDLIANIPGTICADTVVYPNYITVTQGPVAAFIYTQTDLVDPFNNVIDFTNGSNFSTNYSWNFGDGGESTEISPQHIYHTNDSVWVVLFAYNELGCYDTAMTRVSLTPFGDLQVPNAFAPNSGVPGANVFLPVGIGLVEYEIAVYATWGDEVWRTNKLDELGRPSEPWDGRDKNGQIMNSDAFVWKVHKAKFKGNREWKGMSYGRNKEKQERIGTLTLLR